MHGQLKDQIICKIIKQHGTESTKRWQRIPFFQIFLSWWCKMVVINHTIFSSHANDIFIIRTTRWGYFIPTELHARCWWLPNQKLLWSSTSWTCQDNLIAWVFELFSETGLKLKPTLHPLTLSFSPYLLFFSILSTNKNFQPYSLCMAWGPS